MGKHAGLLLKRLTGDFMTKHQKFITNPYRQLAIKIILRALRDCRHPDLAIQTDAIKWLGSTDALIYLAELNLEHINPEQVIKKVQNHTGRLGRMNFIGGPNSNV